MNEMMLKSVKGKILFKEMLSGHTSYRIGGPADYYITPKDVEDIRTILEIAEKQQLPWFVIGEGSNLLVSDTGFRGIVLDLSKAFNQIDSRGTEMTVGAGVLLWDLLRYCTEFGLTGLEQLTGIPGQIGGGVVLNAGAFDEEIFSTIQSVKFISPTGIIETRDREDIHPGYRKTDLPKNIVILEIELALRNGNPAEIQMIQKEILKKRRDKQPLSLPSAGSVFKRPSGDYAGRLIEEAGCKGLRIGDAMVSRKHANFIVNVHLASALDVMRVINEVKERVLAKSGVMLEPEIHFLGFDQPEKG